MVVGGGPAGMEVARLASLRGHKVTLFEKERVLGGKVASGARIGGHAEYANVSAHLERELRKTNATLRMGEAATIEIDTRYCAQDRRHRCRRDTRRARYAR